MELDQVMRHTGRACPYVIISVGLLSIFGMLANNQNILTNYLSPGLDHWCTVPELAGLPAEQQKYISSPYDDTKGVYQGCQVYNASWEDYR